MDMIMRRLWPQIMPVPNSGSVGVDIVAWLSSNSVYVGKWECLMSIYVISPDTIIVPSTLW